MTNGIEASEKPPSNFIIHFGVCTYIFYTRIFYTVLVIFIYFIFL